MYTYLIKKPKHVLEHLKTNKVLCVHKYKYSHAKARKVCRKMLKEGLVHSEPFNDVFLITLVVLPTG